MNGQRIIEVSETSGVFSYFRLSREGVIGVERLWRLVHDGRIAVTGEDHGQQFGLPAPVDAIARVTSLLADAAIERVEIRHGTADLIVHFDLPFRLEIISTSFGYESWQIAASDGRSVIAAGGGQLCHAPPVGESRTVTSIPIE